MLLQRIHTNPVCKALRNQGHLLIGLLFFSLFSVFLFRYIDPAVIFSGNGIGIHRHVAIMHSPNSTLYPDLLYQPQFILELTHTYFHDIAVTPGGWTRLAVTLLIYACGNPVLGTLAITAPALFFYFIFALYINNAGGRLPLILRLAPAFFIMTLCTWYELDFCVFLLPVGGALALAVLYQRLRHGNAITAAIMLSAFFWIAWYLMQWGSLLFLLFILIHDLLTDRRRALLAGAAAAVNCTLLYLTETLFLPLDMTIRWSNFTLMSSLPLAVIGYFILVAVTLPLLNRIQFLHNRMVTITGELVDIALLVCLTVAAAGWYRHDPVNRDTRIIAKTMYSMMNNRWDEILLEKNRTFFEGFPKKSGQLQLLMVHAVNHALERTGHLGDRLFDYPQATFSYDPLIMLHSMTVQSYVNWIAVLDVAMDLGMVSTAERIAGELMENMGPYPVVLYKRALIQIAMGNRETAEVYLNRLTHMPYYRNDAEQLLTKLYNNEAQSVPRIAAMIRNKDRIDYLQNDNLSCDAVLNYLLSSNPDNKVAYDYLMTFHLLGKRFDLAAPLSSSARKFGYTTLPRSWKEGLYLYQTYTSLQDTSASAVPGAGAETEKRFTEFTKAMIATGNDPAGAAKLAPAFGNSFFYYTIFSYSPGVFNE